MEWRSLSEREGWRVPDGPFEGVPQHLSGPLSYWLEQALWKGDAKSSVLEIAPKARVPVKVPYIQRSPVYAIRALLDACEESHEAFLSVIDAALATMPCDTAKLRNILEIGGSAWTVSADGTELRRRIDPVTQQAADKAMAHDDTASEELRNAWAAAYGRNPDGSDAWDHAIKAAEAVLIPLIVPTQTKPTMGHVMGQLRTQGDRWKLVLPGADGSYSVAPLTGILDLLWPNPDRHASGNGKAPTLDEAQAVVQLALTVVQWVRDGAVRRTN